jgi:hypothetical protein
MSGDDALREQARLLRYVAAGFRAAETKKRLDDLARQCEELAESIEQDDC